MYFFLINNIVHLLQLPVLTHYFTHRRSSYLMPLRLPKARIKAQTPQIVHPPLRGAHHLVLVDGIGADAADAQQVAEAAHGTVEAAAEMVEYGREIAHRMAAMDWATVRWHARRFAGRWQPSSHR